MRTLDSDAEACGSPPRDKGGNGPDQNRHTPNGSLAAALSSGKGVQPTTALSKHEPSPVAVHTTKVAMDAAWPSPHVWPSERPRPPVPADGHVTGAPIAVPDGQGAGSVAQGLQEKAAAEKAAAEKATAKKVAKDKAAAEKVTAEKTAAEKISTAMRTCACAAHRQPAPKGERKAARRIVLNAGLVADAWQETRHPPGTLESCPDF